MKEDRIQVKVSAVQMIPRGGSMLLKNQRLRWVNGFEKLHVVLMIGV